MLELGKFSESAHQDVGKYLAKAKIDRLITVGERSRDIYRGAKAAGMGGDHMFHFPYSEEAGWFLQERINQGDLILIKGSQGVRMEKAVKEIMAEPMRAQELLVRQDKEWLNA
jgi:UDP-N-acetylmuramoyl-tripeptide--D-alanyl-D-alanine ligase